MPNPSVSNVVPVGAVIVAPVAEAKFANVTSIVSFLWYDIPCAVKVVPLWDPIPFILSNPNLYTIEFKSVSKSFVLLVKVPVSTLLVISTSIDGVFACPKVEFEIAIDSISLVE